MPWNNGQFTRTNDQYDGENIWQDEAGDGDPTIKSLNHDRHDQDLADGISACLNLDGQNVMRSGLDMGGFEVTNIGEPTQDSSAASRQFVIQQIQGASAPSLGDLLDVNTTGAVDGSVIKYQAGEWVIGSDSGGGSGSSTFLGLTDTPISYAGNEGDYCRVNTAGTQLIFQTLADVARTGDYNDLSNTPSELGTDLSVVPFSSAVTIVSSSGDNATLSSATTGQAGLLSSSDKAKLDGLSPSSGTNLSASTTTTSVTINSSTGSNVALPVASSGGPSRAGIITSATKGLIDGSLQSDSVALSETAAEDGINLQFSDTNALGSPVVADVDLPLWRPANPEAGLFSGDVRANAPSSTEGKPPGYIWLVYD